MHVLFRFDAGDDVGNGHLIRSSVLARTLRQRGHRVRVLSRPVPVALQHHLDGLDQIRLPPQDPGLGPLAEVASESPLDWLVIDHYQIDARWESAAAPFARRVLVIDDLADRPHACDALLDQNVPNSLQARYDALVPPGSRRWLGLDYLLARPGFYQARQSAGAGLLVFLGGGNHRQALMRLLPVLEAACPGEKLELMLTQAYGDLQEWRAQAGPACRVHQDLQDTSDLCRSVAGAVVRCGFIAYELSLVGTPMVILHGTPVQREVAHALEAMGHGVALAEQDMFDAICLAEALGRMRELRPQVLGGLRTNGAQRIAELMENFDDQ